MRRYIACVGCFLDCIILLPSCQGAFKMISFRTPCACLACGDAAQNTLPNFGRCERSGVLGRCEIWWVKGFLFRSSSHRNRSLLFFCFHPRCLEKVIIHLLHSRDLPKSASVCFDKFDKFHGFDGFRLDRTLLHFDRGCHVPFLRWLGSYAKYRRTPGLLQNPRRCCRPLAGPADPGLTL